MNFEILIPITLFICIVYAIKSVVDARVRSKLIAANGSDELVRSMLQGEAHQRRHNSLRWGIVLLALSARREARCHERTRQGGRSARPPRRDALPPQASLREVR